MLETSFISIFKSIDLARRKIPLIVNKSKNPGPTIWVVAAIHGDEVTGTETVLRLNNILKRSLKNGTIYSLPIMNPLGYEMITRNEPLQSADLNRCFPGSPKGDTAERIVYEIYSKITQTKPDLVIDLHTDSMESIPYIYLDQVLDRKNSHLVKKLLDYAQVSGVNYFVEGSETYSDFERSITGALINLAKIPSFTLELGGPRVVREKFVEIGLNVVKNILAYEGLIESAGQKWEYRQKLPLKGIYETVWYQYTPDYSGIVEYKVQPGDIVKKGQILARIKNLFNKTIQVITAKEESVIISYADQSVCFPGTELFMTAHRNDKAFVFRKS